MTVEIPIRGPTKKSFNYKETIYFESEGFHRFLSNLRLIHQSPKKENKAQKHVNKPGAASSRPGDSAWCLLAEAGASLPLSSCSEPGA